MTDPLYFAGTCVLVNKGNCSGNYIDPCDCRKYYQCNKNQYTLIPQVCGQSLAFNDRRGNCDYNTTVLYQGICNFTAPWRRCNVSAVREQELHSLCTNITHTLSPTSTTQGAPVREQELQSLCTNITPTLIPSSTTQGAPEIAQTSKDEDKIGLIVGLVIALIILVILAVAFSVFWLHRRRKQKRNDVSEHSEEEDPQNQSFPAGYENDIVQETRIAKGGNVLYENCFGQHGSTACRLTVLPPVHIGIKTEPAEKTTQSVSIKEEDVSIHAGQSTSTTQSIMVYDPRPPWPFKIIKELLSDPYYLTVT